MMIGLMSPFSKSDFSRTFENISKCKKYRLYAQAMFRAQKLFREAEEPMEAEEKAAKKAAEEKAAEERKR